MKIVFSSLAQRELEDAIQYYELESPGLGGKFKQEARKAALRISQHPEAWSIERGEIRKCLLQRFPYKLLYSIEKGHIFIVAVAHLHRRPDYWIERDQT